MKMNALNHYVCPHCRGVLGPGEIVAASNSDESILEADLFCSGCKRSYPVKNGIPRFVDSSNYAESFGYQWNIHRKTQLDSHTGLPISRDRVFGVTGWPKDMRGQVILEAGSGAGRFTEILLGTGATLFSFDYSLAVEANCANNGHAENLHLFQGDIYHIPLREKQFDKVFCLGVIQHTPDPEKAMKSLGRYVKPGGQLVIDVYEKRLISYLHWRYLLRPFTRRMNKESLYKWVNRIVPVLLPVAVRLRRIAGSVGARLLPIPDYSNLGLSHEMNRQWSILDTFDIYSPAHDHPQTPSTIRRWFEDEGFVDIEVGYGPNGVVAKGRKPHQEYHRQSDQCAA